MINLKTEVAQALESNQALVALLGGTRVYQMSAPDPTEFPRITFFELTNFDDHFADDKPVSSEIHIQIDIWHQKGTSDIAIEVDRTMKAAGWRRSGTADLYETESKIYHKAMRYMTSRPIEEE